MAAALARVKQEHLDWMQSSGISSVALAKIGMMQEPFGIAEAEFLESGLYKPITDLSALKAVIQPVYESGDLIDLIAWSIIKPKDWHWRTGSGWALGIDAIWKGGVHEDFNSISIHATPFDWLAAEGEGITILDWNAPQIRMLAEFGQLVCFDRRISNRISKTLSQPFQAPQIVIEGDRRAS